MTIVNTALLVLLVLLIMAVLVVAGFTCEANAKPRPHKTRVFISYENFIEKKKIRKDLAQTMRLAGIRTRVKTQRLDFPFKNSPALTHEEKALWMLDADRHLRAHIAKNFKRYRNIYKLVLAPTYGITGIAYGICVNPFASRIGVVWGNRNMREFEGRGEGLSILALAHELGHLMGMEHTKWDDPRGCIASTYFHGYAYMQWLAGETSFWPKWCQETKQDMRRCLG